jgi:predicted phosphodiesterase
MRVLAIGDIHCKTWIIDRVIELLPEYDRIVFVGDYADNWGASATDSVATWADLHVLSLANPEKLSLVRGNHDYIYTEQTPTLQSGFNPETQALLNSQGYQFLKEWLRALPIVLDVDGVTYSHAGIDERWDGGLSVGSLWTDVSPLWVRPGSARYKSIPQVFGHTPQLTCTEIQPNIWAIDTFSQYPAGDQIGDGTVLEIVDGKTFTKRVLDD